MIIKYIQASILLISLIGVSLASYAQTYIYKCPAPKWILHAGSNAYGIITIKSNGYFHGVKPAQGPSKVAPHHKVGKNSGVMISLGKGHNQMQCLYGFYGSNNQATIAAYIKSSLTCKINPDAKTWSVICKPRH